jgi:hypothetical protein
MPSSFSRNMKDQKKKKRKKAALPPRSCVPSCHLFGRKKGGVLLLPLLALYGILSSEGVVAQEGSTFLGLFYSLLYLC